MKEIEIVNAEQSPLDEAAEVLKKTGIYENEFNSEKSVVIMSKFVLSIMRKRGATVANVEKMLVNIDNNCGIIDTTVAVKRPVDATIDITCSLENDTDEGKIKLAGIEINPKKAGIRARLAMKADNTLGKTREELRKPNEAFMEFLNDQFKTRGVKINELGLHFNESALCVKIKRESSGMKR